MKKIFITITLTYLLLLTACATGTQAAENGQDYSSCKISINCETVFDNFEKLSKGKDEIIPEDGFLLPVTEVPLLDGETAFDVLLRVTKEMGIHMEHTKTPVYKNSYIEGINNLYEFDCGELSGWMYKVNGVYPNYGSSSYAMDDGDDLVWVFTCDLGRDIGADWKSQNQ